MTNKLWTQEEIQQLHNLWINRPDINVKQLGAMFGRPKNSVISLIGRKRYDEGKEKWPMRQAGTGGRVRRQREYWDKAHPKIELVPTQQPSMPKLPVTSLGNEKPRKVVKFDPLPPKTCVVCDGPRAQGSYCLEHAKQIYQPREEKNVRPTTRSTVVRTNF